MKTKICNRCGERKKITSFRKRNKKIEGRVQPYCLPCQREYDREYWDRTRERRNRLKRTLDRNLRIRKKEAVYKYLRENSCVDCGEKDTAVLEFDHIYGKSDNVSDLVRRRASLKRIFEEIKKCEVRCANCHRRKTDKERRKKMENI